MADSSGRLPCRFQGCSTTFTRSDNRLVHERRHTGTPGCELARFFLDLSRLMPSERKVVCELCLWAGQGEKVFWKNSDLTRHQGGSGCVAHAQFKPPRN